MNEEKQDIATKIVNRLFANGFGERADRLVLELPSGHTVGGLCRQSVIDVVNEEIAILKAEIKRKDEATENIKAEIAALATYCDKFVMDGFTTPELDVLFKWLERLSAKALSEVKENDNK